MNDLERQLRSWVPRRPSARLEQRLFPRPEPQPAPRAHRTLGWLAPAGASLLFLALVISQHNTSAIGSGGSSPIVALILSNQSAAAYLSGTVSDTQNRLPAGYEWSLRPGSISNADILPLRQFSPRPAR